MRYGDGDVSFQSFRPRQSFFLAMSTTKSCKECEKKGSSLIQTNVKGISSLALSDFAIYPNQEVVSDNDYSWPQSGMIIFSLCSLSETYFPTLAIY
jgi:hypothetical protein